MRTRATRRLEKLLRPLCVVGAALVATVLAACDGAAAPPTCEPTYVAAATDEAYAVLSARTDFKNDDPAGPKVLAPTAGQTFAVTDPAPTFSWDSALQTLLAPSPLPPADAPTRPRRGLLDRVRNAILPEAFAHQPPVTGGMYIASIALPGEDCPSEVMTSDLTLTIDAAAWAKLTAAKGTFTLDLKSAYFVEGRISDGPYRSQVQFAIE